MTKTEGNKQHYHFNITINGDFKVAESIININTGYVTDLSVQDKLIYTHLRTQYNNFSKKGLDYFESNLSVGLENAISESTVKRSIKKLAELGLVIISGTKVHRTFSIINITTKNYKLLCPKSDYYHTEEAANKRAAASEVKAKVIADKRKEHEDAEESRKEVKRKENEENSRRYLNHKYNTELINRKRVLLTNVNYKQKEFLENEILTIEMNIYSVKYQRTKEKDQEFSSLAHDVKVVSNVVCNPNINELPPVDDEWFNSCMEDMNSGRYDNEYEVGNNYGL